MSLYLTHIHEKVLEALYFFYCLYKQKADIYIYIYIIFFLFVCIFEPVTNMLSIVTNKCDIDMLKITFLPLWLAGAPIESLI